MSGRENIHDLYENKDDVVVVDALSGDAIDDFSSRVTTMIRIVRDRRIRVWRIRVWRIRVWIFWVKYYLFHQEQENLAL